MRLNHKRALILGGGGAGIGRAVTRAYAAAGASIVVADIDSAGAESAAVEVREAGTAGHALGGDVRVAAELYAMIDNAADILGGLDILVTVVGGQVAFVPAVKLHEMSDEDWDTVYELNLRYVSRAVRATLRHFLEQGHRRNDRQNRLSDRLHGGPPPSGHGVAKAGLLSLARTVAAEYAGDGIRMNVVASGAIATAASGNKSVPGWVEEIPVGRYGRAEEIAAAAVYLATDESAYVTGQQIVLDGGVSTRGPFG